MKRLISYIALILAIGGYLAGCGTKEKSEENKAVAKTVVIAPIGRTDIVQKVILTGTVKPIEDSVISAEVAGSIIEKSVKLGDYIKKDTILAKIDEETYGKVYNQAEAILNVAQASLEQSKATQKQLQDDQATNERLFQQNVISRKVLDDINTKLAEVNAMVKVSEAKVKEAEIARDVAKISLDKATVKCPLEKAYVADVSFEVGNYVIPGKPLVRLVNIEQVWIEVGVGEKQITELEKRIAEAKAQDKDKKAYATFIVPTIGSKEYKGSIEEVSPYADPVTGSFILRMRFDNASHELKSGMFALVTLPINIRLNSLVVPQSSVIKDAGISYVFIANSSKARRIEVKTGVSQNEQIEIIEGLTGTETIVIDGADLLADGDIINPLSSTSKETTKGEDTEAK